MDAGFIYSKSGLWLQDNVSVGGIKSITPPPLTATIGTYKPAWMDMPIPVDTGMEAMQLEFKTGCDQDVLTLFGFVQGNTTRAQVRRTFKDTNGDFHTWVDEFEGIIATVEQDETATDSQENVGMSVTMNLSYYKLTADDKVLIEIDPAHMIRSINGVNALAYEKSALRK